MFPCSSIDDLTSDDVYLFNSCNPVYLELLKCYSSIFDYDVMNELVDEEVFNYGYLFWWVINETWELYGKINPAIPMRWLAISKRALQWDYMPGNFHPWALAILESFDLPRYQAAYHLPLDEFTAIEQDLPVVLEGLRNYPKENLAEPMDEDNWGLVDQ
ncbi:hypothetical protein HA050_03700 [Iodobacter sp. HSC-16F04]|uniref:Uncharacterized protein n=1 Tax=Iodobacter violaceini TaxID=3044271 RepID=A0ABX0KT51_9NEIS|nr:hypothetical protein [Iodobacter violacea]NHQ85214.1 hypothetical protein [Iodobacter violacea]